MSQEQTNQTPDTKEPVPVECPQPAEQPKTEEKVDKAVLIKQLKTEIVKYIRRNKKSYRLISKLLRLPNAHYFGGANEVLYKTPEEFATLVATNEPYVSMSLINVLYGTPSLPKKVFCGPIHEASTYLIVENNCHEQTYPVPGTEEGRDGLGPFRVDNQKGFDYEIVTLEVLIERLFDFIVQSSPLLIREGTPELYEKMRTFIVNRFAEYGLCLSQETPDSQVTAPSKVYKVEYNVLRMMTFEIIKALVDKLCVPDTYLRDFVPLEAFEFMMNTIADVIFIVKTAYVPPADADPYYTLEEFIGQFSGLHIKCIKTKFPEQACAACACYGKPKRHHHECKLRWLARYLKHLKKCFKRSVRVIAVLKMYTRSHYYRNAVPDLQLMNTSAESFGYSGSTVYDAPLTWLMVVNKPCEKSIIGYPLPLDYSLPDEQRAYPFTVDFDNQQGFNYMMVNLDSLLTSLTTWIIQSSKIAQTVLLPPYAETIKAFLLAKFTERGVIVNDLQAINPCRHVYKVEFEALRCFVDEAVSQIVKQLQFTDSYLFQCAVPRQFFDFAMYNTALVFYFTDASDATDIVPYYDFQEFPKRLRISISAQCLRL